MNSKLKDLIRAMLSHKNVPNAFWAEALCTAAYVRNQADFFKRTRLLFICGSGKRQMLHIFVESAVFPKLLDISTPNALSDLD